VGDAQISLAACPRVGVVQAIQFGWNLEGRRHVRSINLFNHANYGGYSLVQGTPSFGQPVQNVANTYLPRSLQLAFRVLF
jgi:hypothetical protein